MKKVAIIASLLISFSAFAQQGKLGCDSATIRTDTTTGWISYADTTSGTVRVVKAVIVQKSCKLMYFGLNGAPNAKTDQEGVYEILFFVPDPKQPNKRIPLSKELVIGVTPRK